MLLTLGDETQLRGMLFWLMGDLSLSGRPGPLLALFWPHSWCLSRLHAN